MNNLTLSHSFGLSLLSALFITLFGANCQDPASGQIGAELECQHDTDCLPLGESATCGAMGICELPARDCLQDPGICPWETHCESSEDEGLCQPGCASDDNCSGTDICCPGSGICVPEPAPFQQDHCPQEIVEQPFFCGDFDNSGVVDSLDADLAQQCSVGVIECSTTCDVTNDGVCDTNDARVIQRFVDGELPGSSLQCEAGVASP